MRSSGPNQYSFIWLFTSFWLKILIWFLGVLHWTPTRRVGHQKFTSDDDDMILEYARKKGGVIVTRDQYRDSYDRCPEFKETIEKRYPYICREIYDSSFIL